MFHSISHNISMPFSATNISERFHSTAVPKISPGRTEGSVVPSRYVWHLSTRHSGLMSTQTNNTQAADSFFRQPSIQRHCHSHRKGTAWPLPVQLQTDTEKKIFFGYLWMSLNEWVQMPAPMFQNITQNNNIVRLSVCLSLEMHSDNRRLIYDK